MKLAQYSIKNPVFMTCILIIIMIIGYLLMRTLPIDFYPRVEIPTITVNTVYRGSSPSEVEAQVTKPLEDTISTVPGVYYLRSFSQENLSTIVIEFDLNVDIKFSLDQVRDRINLIRRTLPPHIDEPLVNIFDLSAIPLITISVLSDLSATDIYNIVNQKIRPQLTQVRNLGQVSTAGIQNEEILVQIDRNKLYNAGIFASQLEYSLSQGGQNIPLGQQNNRAGDQNLTYRTIANYTSLNQVRNVPIFSKRNPSPILLRDIATVENRLKDPSQLFYFNSKKAYIIELFRQSGSNNIEVSDGIHKKVAELNEFMKAQNKDIQLKVIKDTSDIIRGNINDVKYAIYLGILLTIIVVYFFLGSARSTLITGLALPNSMLGAFIIMAISGFTINIMTLLSLSLAIGLLIDDAIVVRENIHRHRVRLKKSLRKSAADGTAEVSTAVIATTLCIVAVFTPIAFVQGIVGQFLKEFGLTVCFAMLISLFDALTMAPMLSASLPNWRSRSQKNATIAWLIKTKNRFFDWLESLQKRLEERYVKLLRHVVQYPLKYIAGSSIIFILSLLTFPFVPITFIPPQDQGEIYIDLDLPPGTTLEKMREFTVDIESKLEKEPEVRDIFTKVGSLSGQQNQAQIYVKLVNQKDRTLSTSGYKERLRTILSDFKQANPQIGDGAIVSGTSREYNLNLISNNLKQLELYSKAFVEKIRDRGVLVNITTNIRPGKPEFQVKINDEALDNYGIYSNPVGGELRYYVQGNKVGYLAQEGIQERIPIHMEVDKQQANLQENYDQILIPNANFDPIPLSSISTPVLETGPSTIFRINRTRFIQISAEVDANGPGMSGALKETEKILNDELKLPAEIDFQYYGQAYLFNEMLRNMLFALGTGILFVYLVLCSLYNSFIIPFTVMLALPLALSGALVGLWLFGESLNLFSIIACIMLLGLSTKNSILLVNYAIQQREAKKSYSQSIIAAGRVRLRPILMTSVALIAGMLPIAIGLNEVASQRTSMGIAIIGGTISSTFLSLIVIPAAFNYIDRLDKWLKREIYKNRSA